MSDFLTRLANRSRRVPGQRNAFVPRFEIEPITGFQTKTSNGKAIYSWRYDKEGKRWIDGGSVWGPDAEGAAKRAKKTLDDAFIEAHMAEFEARYKGLLECAGVRQDDGSYISFLEFLGTQEFPFELDSDSIFERVAGKLIEKGLLFGMTAFAARFEGITQEHVELAIAQEVKDRSAYYSGRDKMVPFDEWNSVEGTVPAPKGKPASFDDIDAFIGGDAGEGSGDEPPSGDDGGEDEQPF